MPEGVGAIVTFLCVGYFLVLAELLVPGGILGIFGVASIAYGCWLAFGLSMGWGISSVLLSVVVFAVVVWILLQNRSREGLVLLGDEAKTWKAPKEGLRELIGVEGKTLTPLRPSGTMMVGEERVDVVADAEFLPAGIRVRVLEVEGSRVVVEPADVEPAEIEPVPDAPAEPVTDESEPDRDRQPTA